MATGKIYHISPDYSDDGPGCFIRRLRRAPHISQEQTWIFHKWIQIDLEVGLGTDIGNGSDPQGILRYSNDGGKSWSNDRTGSVGKVGDYKKRVRFRRLGRSRDRVYEWITSDPIPYRIIDAYLSVEGGTH